MSKSKVYLDASEIRFGLLKPRDWLEKAEREAKRVTESEDKIDRLDAALNGLITVQHIEDWVFHACRKLGYGGRESEFKRSARNACPDQKTVTDLCNAAKHFDFELRRAPGIETTLKTVMVLEATISGSLPDPSNAPPGTEVSAVHTMIDDDEIVGFRSVIAGPLVGEGNNRETVHQLLSRTINFWRNAVEGVERNELPDWAASAI